MYVLICLNDVISMTDTIKKQFLFWDQSYSRQQNLDLEMQNYIPSSGKAK